MNSWPIDEWKGNKVQLEHEKYPESLTKKNAIVDDTLKGSENLEIIVVKFSLSNYGMVITKLGFF